MFKGGSANILAWIFAMLPPLNILRNFASCCIPARCRCMCPMRACSRCLGSGTTLPCSLDSLSHGMVFRNLAHVARASCAEYVCVCRCVFQTLGNSLSLNVCLFKPWALVGAAVRPRRRRLLPNDCLRSVSDVSAETRKCKARENKRNPKSAAPILRESIVCDFANVSGAD